MTNSLHKGHHIATWFQTTRGCGLVLAGVILLLYGRSVGWGFVLDDLRQIRLMEDYHQGRRSTLGLYQFLVSDQGNRQARRAGWYVWWVGDDVRYRHWRPASEWLLYGQYLAFGKHPAGYHCVGLVLYVIGTLLVLALFRMVAGDERLARWAALVFAVMAGHAIPVVFISAQSDLLALVLGAAAMLAAGRYVKGGGTARLLLAAAFYSLALGSKEACLPLAVLPVCFALAFRHERGASRRAGSATVLLTMLGLVWFGFYVHGGYGANNSVMLDPVHDPVGYLTAMPGRALALLSSLVIPINPFLFCLRPRGFPWLIGYCVVGAAALVAIGRRIWRGERRRQGVGAMALWILPFLPLLACTVPDDRVMVLPSIGFAFLVGAWITGRPASDRRLNKVPLFLFVAVQAAFAVGAGQFMRFIAVERHAFSRAAVAGFGRLLRPGDCAFFLNDRRDSDVLFVQLRFEEVAGMRDVRAAFLSDAEDPIVSRVDRYRLRIRAADAGLFRGFMGAMGTSRDRPKREGDELDAGEFTGRITKVTDGVVQEVVLRFAKPLESESYRFYSCDLFGRPVLWKLPPAEQPAKESGPPQAPPRVRR